MRFRKSKHKVKIKINFDKQTHEIRIEAVPESIRPTELIQVFMLAINVINQSLQRELKKKKEAKKPRKLGYIG